MNNDSVNELVTSLGDKISRVTKMYFNQFDGKDPENVYSFVLEEIEAPLLEELLKFTRYNQSRTANILGISRGTLRKKLMRYDLL